MFAVLTNHACTMAGALNIKSLVKGCLQACLLLSALSAHILTSITYQVIGHFVKYSK